MIPARTNYFYQTLGKHMWIIVHWITCEQKWNNNKPHYKPKAKSLPCDEEEFYEMVKQYKNSTESEWPQILADRIVVENGFMYTADDILDECKQAVDGAFEYHIQKKINAARKITKFLFLIVMFAIGLIIALLTR